MKFTWVALVIGSCLVVAYFAFGPRLPPCPKVGKKHNCYASSKHIDGSNYVGEWLNNKRHGIGQLSFPDGDVYTGEWSNGKMTGNGEFEFHTGIKYVGQFLDGKFHGWGQLTKTNGHTQEGKWKNGRFLFRFVFPS